MDKKIGHPKAAHHTHTKFTGNDLHSQRMRLLARLREANVSTTEARYELDIMHPAARIQELREQGNLINTVTIAEHTATHRIRHIARYVLAREVGHE
ncbi:MAG: helix-turn-helix domain-containing protein [Nitrosospira sp.]